MIGAPRPVHAEIVTRAGEADAPRGVAGDLAEVDAGEAALLDIAPLDAGVGKNLEAARPLRQKRERLPVAEVEALHANHLSEVALGADLVGAELVGIEAVEGEEFRGGGKHRGAEEILEMPAIGAERDLADAGEVILEARLHGVGGPGLDGGVVDEDAVVGGGRAVGVGEREAAGILVEIGRADAGGNGGAQEEIFAEVVGRVERREEAEVLFFAARAAIEVGEARDREGVGGDREDGAGGRVAERTTLGVALDVAREIGEWARGVDVGLLDAHAADEEEAAVEQRDVAAEVGGGDGLLGVFGAGDVGAVEVVFVEGELVLARAPEGVGLDGVHVLDFREAEGGNAVGEHRVEDRER